MITVTRLNGRSVTINADRIEYLEASPDTTIFFESQHWMVVRESPQEIVRRVIDYKRQVHALPRVAG